MSLYNKDKLIDFKFVLFYISLILFFLAFNPFLPYGLATSWYIHFTGTIAFSYSVVFSIFIFIKYYEKIKKSVSNYQHRISHFLVHKSKDPMKDLLKFTIISIFIIFFIDVILTKISEISYLHTLLNFLGLNELFNLMNLKYSDITDSLTEQEFLNDLQKFESIQHILVFVGPLLGPVILFFLRQLSYKKQSRNKEQNPGARLLLLFFIVTMFLLIIDLYEDIKTNGLSINFHLLKSYFVSNDNTYSENKSSINNITNIATDSPNIITYSISHIILFILKNLLYFHFYISMISIWVLDRYLFSEAWKKRI